MAETGDRNNRDGEGIGDGRPVVEFLSSRDLPEGRSLLREIEDHWRELRARAGGLPRRADLDAGRLAAALPHAFILERAGPGIARIRIAGRVIIGLLGGEAKGLPLSLLVSPGSRGTLQGWLERCFSTPAVVELPLVAPQGAFRMPLTGRLLLLPMLDAEGEVARALGGIFLDGVPRRGPLRFDIPASPVRCHPVTSIEPAKAAIGGAAAPAAVPGFREAERPWLRLVVSNS